MRFHRPLPFTTAISGFTRGTGPATAGEASYAHETTLEGRGSERTAPRRHAGWCSSQATARTKETATRILESVLLAS